MTARQPFRLVPALVVALVLGSSAPVLAAPPPAPPASLDALQVLETLWADLTSPWTSLFAPHDGGADAEGDPGSGSTLDGGEGPDVQPQNGHQIDPNG